jgi:hypothetical protein
MLNKRALYGIIVIFMGLLIFPISVYAQFEPKDLVVTIKEIKILKFENSDVVRVKLNIMNNGPDEASFFAGNFELLDSQLRKFSSVSGYDLEERGESVARGMCETLFGKSTNPGLSLDLEVCFDVPKTNFQYDSLIIYENMFIQSTADAQIVPLIENSIGYQALVEKTELENEDLAMRAEEIESKGGCLIATAAFGTEMASEVQNLREIRNKMYETSEGGEMMNEINNFYYTFSPIVADWERQNTIFKEFVKIGITPLITSFTILDHNTINSDEGFIGFVIGVVLLNIGMYFGTPVIIIYGIRRFKKI